MKRLYVLYDPTCELCRRCRGWLSRQAAFVPLVFLPLNSDEVPCRFPGIERLHPEKEILVISDSGDVWQGGAAWVMCLWALEEYREWSQRLAHPLLLPFARRACELVSEKRYLISRWLAEETTEGLRNQLAVLSPADCGHTGYCKPR
ncbi:MAG: hypothetical protein QOE70_3641 [Chthoniobacter sp.]|jgi:predicted DCC family thiol-disulfide oxidoreductase YuxK|nr:hypothetical protein [Chthoniobacter sp.]